MEYSKRKLLFFASAIVSAVATGFILTSGSISFRVFEIFLAFSMVFLGAGFLLLVKYYPQNIAKWRKKDCLLENESSSIDEENEIKIFFNKIRNLSIVMIILGILDVIKYL